MKLHSILSAALCALALFLSPSAHAAANNPLNIVEADTFSAKSEDIKVEVCAEGGQNLSAIHDGDYLVYKGFDFDSGVAAFKIRIASKARSGKVELHLDSTTGPLMGTSAFSPTGGWQKWQDVTFNVDNSQSGVRDIYLVFHGDGKEPLVSVSQFVFLKSVVLPTQGIDLSGRLDAVDDEPQATKAWGMPETGFADDFESDLSHWNNHGLTLSDESIDGKHSLAAAGSDPVSAFTPDVYINKTDTGGEWRTLAEASLAADIVIDENNAKPGIGFASKDGKQEIYVVLNPANNSMEAHRKLSDGSDVVIRQHPKVLKDPGVKMSLQPGTRYRLQIDWSPYSNGLIAFLYDDKGTAITSVRTAIDLPAARRPLLLCSGGKARFDNVKFDPTLDGWNYKWEWHKQPVLGDDVCNPAVWKGKDGKLYMVWRRFGADTYHGVSSSTDGIHWDRVKNEVMKCTGDMNVVLDPFGDGLTYLTPGSANMAWYTSDGSNNYSDWKASGKTVGDIFGNSRIQEIIDTKRYPQLGPIEWQGKSYRFIAYTEDWNRMPKPHTVVLLSNTLTDWVLADPNPLIPPADTFWGEKGNAIGSAFPLPDGNILIASCSCTFEGYTGAPEPSNVSAIADGKQPWKILKLGILPDAPVSREGVWYQGPNFGTAYYYDADTDTLFFYGGFHDFRIGMMRVQHFLHSEKPAEKAEK